MSERRHLGVRRAVAILTVLIALAGAGIANASVRAYRGRAAAKPSVDSTVVLSGATASDAWSCPGPLPIGARSSSDAVTSSIAIANASTKPVEGDLIISNVTGQNASQAIHIAARSQLSVPLRTTGPPSNAAVGVLVDGGGVGVSEVVQGTMGVSDTACSDHAGPTQYLAAGGSHGANNVSLAIFDPGATPAVASVSFATGTTTIAPPAYQGVPVPAGGVVVLDVGHYVPQQAAFSTTVTAVGGWVVAGESMSVLVGTHLLGELVTASSAGSSKWWFPPAPAGTNVHEGFAIANPNTKSADVELALQGAGPTITQSVDLAPGAATVLNPIPAVGQQSLRFARVTSGAATPIVVERETLVTQSISATVLPTVVRHGHRVLAPVRAFGPQPITRLLGITPGYGLSAPIESPADGWLLPGGASDHTVGESVLIGNPNSTPVTVSVTTLNGAKGATPVLVRVQVGADGCDVLDAGAVVGKALTLPLEVHASSPILAATLLYARGSSGSVGFSASVAIPED
jgi:hypothetical protein